MIGSMQRNIITTQPINKINNEKQRGYRATYSGYTPKN